ncbi:MAG: hypothetical protein K0R88_2823 [Solirubrobacterales bacterium]|nr:hypothetical protein [Solirubrobacterales bacterium]MDF2747839.1 hypothetical protein [Propionibacteriaceae bacterium]
MRIGDLDLPALALNDGSKRGLDRLLICGPRVGDRPCEAAFQQRGLHG